MKKMRRLWILLLTILVLGCSSSSLSLQPTVNLNIASYGSLPSDRSLAGAAMTLILPTGVTPALDPSGQVNTNRLVTASGVAAAGGLAVSAVYIESTGNQPARLSVVVAGKSKDGFGVGEFMTLTLNRMILSSPSAGDFRIYEFAAADLEGKVVVGLQTAIIAVSY